MVVFLDTSAIYALANSADDNHLRAVRGLQAITDAGQELLVHNYVLLESAALLHRRLGWDAVRRFLRDASTFQVRWVDEALHDAAVDRLVKKRGRSSLVDEVSFLVMREVGTRDALAFDQDFAKEGFTLYQP